VVTGRFEDGTHAARGLLEAAVRTAENRRRPARRLDETQQDAKRRRLAGSVRPEEPGDPAALDREAEVVDRNGLAEPLRESVDLDDRQASPSRRRADATTSFG
jgi:hypothetical protein